MSDAPDDMRALDVTDYEIENISPGNQWEECEHIWRVNGDGGMGEATAVICTKCKCPGEMLDRFICWPTT